MEEPSFFRSARDLANELERVHCDVVGYEFLVEENRPKEAKVIHDKIMASFGKLGILLQSFNWSILEPLPSKLQHSAREWSGAVEKVLRRLMVQCLRQEPLVDVADSLQDAYVSIRQLSKSQIPSETEQQAAPPPEMTRGDSQADVGTYDPETLTWTPPNGNPGKVARDPQSIPARVFAAWFNDANKPSEEKKGFDPAPNKNPQQKKPKAHQAFRDLVGVFKKFGFTCLG